ncbi:MAG: hypothetical protein ACRCYT_00455 [Cetobacterium sp.]
MKDNTFEYISYEDENGEVIETEVPLKKEEIYYLSGEEKYWLFSSGKSEELFDSFEEEGVIGIGWDQISLDEIKENTEFQLKKLVKERYSELENNYTSAKGFIQYISLTTNKLKRFVNEINLGDIVVLKDRGKNQIKFGKIISEAKKSSNVNLVIDNSLGYCNKVRKVKWLRTINKDDAESELKLALSARHAVSIISNEKVKDEINREIFSLFYRNEDLHMIFRIEKKENIQFDEFNEFQNIINELKKECLENTGTENRLNIKSNVQSPGPLEYFGNPEIIKYLYRTLIVVGGVGTVRVSYALLKNNLQIKEPQTRIDDGTSQGN